MSRYAFVALILAAGCTWLENPVLKPGFCNADRDCQVGYRCDVNGTWKCSATGGDGGADATGDAGATDGGTDRTDGGGDSTDAQVDKTPACSSSSSCAAATPICAASGTCVACNGPAVPAQSCAMRDPAAPLCGENGMCIQCMSNTDCKRPGAPVCDLATKTCVPCSSGGICAEINSMTPVCVPSGGDAGTGGNGGSDAAVGPLAGSCVQCLSNADCGDKRPVCTAPTSTCGPCSTDADCAGVGPGVCLSHLDGRCALNAETIYVEHSATCSNAAGSGSKSTPFCSLDQALADAGIGRTVIVVRGPVDGAPTPFSGARLSGERVSIIGQNQGVISPAAGNKSPLVTINGASVYVRDVSISNGADLGISITGGYLEMERVSVTNNAKGGVLIDASAFQLRRSKVVSNGPADLMGLAWGGVRVQGASVTPRALDGVTISLNSGGGLSCAAGGITASAVYVAMNPQGQDVSPSCGITTCSTLGAGCGADKVP